MASSFVDLTGDVFEVTLLDVELPTLIKDAPASNSGPAGPPGPAGGVASPTISGRWSLATVFGAVTTTTLTAGRAYAVPYVPRSNATIDQLGGDIATAVAGSLMRLGIYADGGDGKPAGQLGGGDTGQLDCSTTGFKSGALPSPVAVTGGQTYWLVCCAQGTAVPVPRGVNGAQPLLSVDNAALSGAGSFRMTHDTTSPLPASWTTLYQIDVPSPLLRARAL